MTTADFRERLTEMFDPERSRWPRSARISPEDAKGIRDCIYQLDHVTVPVNIPDHVCPPGAICNLDGVNVFESAEVPAGAIEWSY